MPAQLPVPGVARISITGVAAGINCTAVFHWRATDAAGTAFAVGELQTLANGFGSAWDSSFVTFFGTQYGPGSTIALDLTSNLGTAATRVNTGIGISTSAKVPQSACCVVSWRIARHYRGGHPRTYLGPLGDAAVQNPTTLSAGTVTNFQSGANAFMGLVNALTPGGRHGQMVCVHRWRDKVQLSPPQTTAIDSVQVDNRIDTQRRRLGKDR